MDAVKRDSHAFLNSQWSCKIETIVKVANSAEAMNATEAVKLWIESIPK